MADAATDQRWNHTGSLMALLANVHRDPKKKPSPYKPADFHPRKEPRPRKHEQLEVDQKEGFRLLKQVFVTKSPPRSDPAHASQ